MLRNNSPWRIAAIHDLSSVGRCSLTALLPILSVMGYQVVPLPTALLSSQTWGFDHPTFLDLTKEMEGATKEFSEMELTFRAVYPGFLGDARQIDLVESFWERFGSQPDETGKPPIFFLDPVMGEDGRLYSTYTAELAKGMRRLAAKADYVTPNLTEACFLLNEEYRDTRELAGEQIRPYVQALLLELLQLGAKNAVITGVEDNAGNITNYLVDENKCFYEVASKKVGGIFPGTGDIFASVLLGYLLKGLYFDDAVRLSAEFVKTCMEDSVASHALPREGVYLEKHLKRLI